MRSAKRPKPPHPSRPRRSIARRKSIGSVPPLVRQKFMVEHRQEQRAQRDLAVQVSGRDSNGTAFTQSVTASNISRSGALLSGLSRGIRSGDLLWVEYERRRARFRIVWVRDSQTGLKTQAAVQRLGEGRASVADIGPLFLNSGMRGANRSKTPGALVL